MMMIILAWKNIWRNKKRSIVIMTATALGLAGGLFSIGVMTGMYQSMVDSAINRELGDIQIHTADFKKDQLIGQFLPDIDSIVAVVRSTPNVRSFTEHTMIEGMASSATTAAGVTIEGIDTVQEQSVTAVSKSLIEGTYLQRKNSIVVGKKLADKLKLKLHSRIILSFSGLDGSIIYGAFRIGGIFKTEASTFDGASVFVRREDLPVLLGTAAPIHEIIIRVKDPFILGQTKSEIQRAVPPSVTVETWREISPELKLTADSTDVTNTVFLTIILFALLFGLTNTLLMSVLDRVRDFGVLLAIGMYRRRLFSMIVLESLFLSFTGGVVGVVVGWAVTQYFQVQGIDLSTFSDGLSAYGIPSMLYPFIKTSLYGLLTVMMVVTSVIAALYPAFKAIRLKPVEAIRSIG
jgi:putative ABC transport system permease protein